MTSPFPADVFMTPSAERLHGADGALAAAGQQAPLDLTVFISCYNEAPYILATIQTLRDALKELAVLVMKLSWWMIVRKTTRAR